jgi:hypothetical protein
MSSQILAQSIAHVSFNHLFGPTFRQPCLSALIDRRSTLDNRDPFFEQRVVDIFRKLERIIVDVFNASFPDCAARQRQHAA